MDKNMDEDNLRNDFEADQNEPWEKEFWAEKLRTSNEQLRELLSRQVVIV